MTVLSDDFFTIFDDHIHIIYFNIVDAARMMQQYPGFAPIRATPDYFEIRKTKQGVTECNDQKEKNP